MQKEKKNNKVNKKNTNKTQTSRVTRMLADDTPFAIKEAYKSTRTNIIFSLQEEKCRKIITTSAFPKEGKTTTCVNLAITFAQTGAKVLLVDADLRKPRMHKMFDTTHKIGLTNILSGLNSVDEGIISTNYPNLDLLISGHIPPNPAELLASEAMNNLIDTLSERYDYIFFDTPPVNIVTDAIVLSDKVSGVFLVVRLGITDHRSLKEALSRLEFANCKPVGFILNDIDERSNSYKYKYKYKYGKYNYYKYGYSKYGYR